ncbi:hypothetical protein IMZ11_07480 [Microtetraspora sp. AC03309]|uniref:hypothetical protein n=1 Tax=Microtetraspora sp. AC03309 TaxID=2779376 RepID=UPI001E5C5A3E|nr:hypothetical protein [Microtetraspora sp. AC03309]MCC5575482.1 hypothetical protein [Microtetraspora sp. AC03309]
MDPHYLADARHIWTTYVPRRGQADTVQGELLRAVEKLRDEAQRNGNVNWDEHHERLLAYLRTRLTASRLFDTATSAMLVVDLDRVADYQHPLTEDAPFDRVACRVVDWYRAHPEPVPHEQDPHLQR